MLDTHRLLKESAQRAEVLIQRFSSLFLGSEPTIASFYVSWYAGRKRKYGATYCTEQKVVPPRQFYQDPSKQRFTLSICIQPHAALWDKSWQGN